MATILPTTRPMLWALEAGSRIEYTGITDVGSLTGTAPDYVTHVADSEPEYLAAVAGKAGDYKPLPDSGTLQAGEIYGYDGGLVIVRQTHNRTGHAPGDVPALFSVYRPDAEATLAWIANEPVLVGTQREYDGVVYAAIQAHTTQEDWTPDATPALWSVVVAEPEPGETPAWAAGQTVAIGDLRTYNGVTYRCIQAHTTQAGWTPPVVPALWAAVA